uniref:Uncharacterized protein n=1 Tax=Anguilla anguilla TaxID=7936 RepID=A0A0E9U938_ANGAN
MRFPKGHFRKTALFSFISLNRNDDWQEFNLQSRVVKCYNRERMSQEIKWTLLLVIMRKCVC